MAAEFAVSIIAELTGLGKDQAFTDKGIDSTTPTANTGVPYRTLAVADTEDVLDVGDVATTRAIVIRAVTNDLDVDLDFVAAFDADFTLTAGGIPAIIPLPAGTVYVKNNGAGETPVYEAWVIGTT